MKLYLCDKKCPCGMFAEMLLRLKQIGIEPEICDDNPEEIYFSYNLPCSTIAEERQFNISLFMGMNDDGRRPCIICCGRGYDTTHGSVCGKCGEHLNVCTSCMEQNRVALVNCPICMMVTQDEREAARYHSKSIRDIIPDLLDGDHFGMSLARLTCRLESACGRKLEQAEINQVIAALIQEGTIESRGRWFRSTDIRE